MTAKTNAARALDKLGIAYRLLAYRADAEDLSPERLSRELAMPAEQIYKTLVARAEPGGLVFVVIPLGAELDRKALARAAIAKRVELLSRSQLTAAGWVRGSVTALGAKKPLPVYIEQACRELPQLGVSAGAPGLELVLAPNDYVSATGARLLQLTAAKT